ncbi:hypothetical protein A2U01_0105341, partial [Trifolium medium]|nr:hypothetical protein [Trifolium medium]
DEDDVGEDSKSMEFIKDLIVTPLDDGENYEGKNDVGVVVKRSFSKAFDDVAKRRGNKRFKPVKVKIEKE